MSEIPGLSHISIGSVPATRVNHPDFTNSISIRVNNGYFTLIDVEDLSLFLKYTWSRDSEGYIRHCFRRKGGTGALLLHRLIMGAAKGQKIDHVNHNPSDNRRCNLRLATTSQNGQNSLKPRRPSSSRFKGVRFDPKRRYWMARILVDGKRLYVGCHQNEEDAARAYNAAAIQYFGEFACLNQVVPLVNTTVIRKCLHCGDALPLPKNAGQKLCDSVIANVSGVHLPR